MGYLYTGPRSVQQVNTAISSACAEIYALFDAIKSVRLYRYRAMELGMAVLVPLQVKVLSLIHI